jgi:hypothetical protein
MQKGLLLLFLCAAPACSSSAGSASSSGGQTGEEGGGCVRVKEEPLARDEVSPIGVSPNDVLELMSEPFFARLWWSDRGLEVDDGTSTRAHLEFTPGDRPAIYVKEGDVATRDPRGCKAYVLVGGELRFRTEDGSFDEVWSEYLRTEQGGPTTVLAELPWGKMSGSYDVAPLVPEGYAAESGAAFVSFHATDAGRVAEGLLVGSAEIEGNEYDLVNFRVGTLRADTWGEPCASGVPRDSAGERCDFVVKDVCFPSSEAACACAGCAADKCMILESYPAQIRCQ